MSSFFEKILEREVDTVNNHLPEKRVPLSSLLSTDTPEYQTRSGTLSCFDSAELLRIAEEVPTNLHATIHLPVVILRRMDYGPGIYSLAGGKNELFTIHRLLGYVDLEWSERSNWRTVDRLARPQVQVLRRVLPTTTCIGFTTNISKTGE